MAGNGKAGMPGQALFSSSNKGYATSSVAHALQLAPLRLHWFVGMAMSTTRKLHVANICVLLLVTHEYPYFSGFRSRCKVLLHAHLTGSTLYRPAWPAGVVRAATLGDALGPQAEQGSRTLRSAR